MIKSTASKRRSAKLQVQERRQMHYKIDIRPLKAFTAEKLPRSWPLRKALLTERDTLAAEEFLSKMETWLNLLGVTYC